jgi:hypothetical protein
MSTALGVGWLWGRFLAGGRYRRQILHEWHEPLDDVVLRSERGAVQRREIVRVFVVNIRPKLQEEVEKLKTTSEHITVPLSRQWPLVGH